MNKVKISPLQEPINVNITIPGSLTYTIRALNIAAMTRGTVRINTPLKSDDTYAMFNILKDLGIEVSEEDNAFIVTGSIFDVKEGDYTLDVNISGRTTRMAMSLLAMCPGTKTMICKESFKKRPVGDLVEGLRQLGADIEYLEKEGHLPLKINSQGLTGTKVSMPGEVSSQFFSSLMMIAPLIDGLEIIVEGEQTSKSFIDATVDIMNSFSVNVINNNYSSYIVKSGQTYNLSEYTIEPDASTASYYFAIAAVTGSTIRINNLPPYGGHEDKKFADLLEMMGCKVTKNVDENYIEVTGSNQLNGINIDMNNMPDLAQTLAVVACFANSPTKITGIGNLIYKETDRLGSTVTELNKLGVNAYCDDDSMTIEPTQNLKFSEIETYDDHRMALAFSVFGVANPQGVIINDAQVVSKSYPEYWEDLTKIGIDVQTIA
jgi:3-phosphoshikimate 1-carboxyvinyltransferase